MSVANTGKSIIAHLEWTAVSQVKINISTRYVLIHLIFLKCFLGWFLLFSVSNTLTKITSVNSFNRPFETVTSPLGLSMLLIDSYVASLYSCFLVSCLTTIVILDGFVYKLCDSIDGGQWIGLVKSLLIAYN